MKRIPTLLLTSVMAMVALGCGASRSMGDNSPPIPKESASAPALQRSLFSRDLTGSVSEHDIQTILGSRVELGFPARMGVVVLGEPFRAESAASIDQHSMIGPAMVRALDASPYVSHITDISTVLPNPQGIEGLRTIAARYRVRYLLVCHVAAEDGSHLNNWAWLYPTVLGFFMAPGVTVGSHGHVEASLLDVKTGTVQFTTMEPFESSSVTWVIGSSRHHEQQDAKALQNALDALARSVLMQMERVAKWEKNQEKSPAHTEPEDLALR